MPLKALNRRNPSKGYCPRPKIWEINNMKWLTDNVRLEQTDKNGIWKTLDNQLFQDEDGRIYLAPRYILTDGYTIPNWIAWLGGSKMQWDTRCSTQHDLECKYAQVIVVTLTEWQLRRLRYLKVYNNKIVCENIPKKYLFVKKTTFNETNNRFKRMMMTSFNIPKWRVNLMRFAVNFNFGWHSCKDSIDLNKIYKEEL